MSQPLSSVDVYDVIRLFNITHNTHNMGTIKPKSQLDFLDP